MLYYEGTYTVMTILIQNAFDEISAVRMAVVDNDIREL